MRIGMIGLGVIAPFYAAALEQIEEAELVAVCDLDPLQIAPYRRPGLVEFTSYRLLLESSDVEAVLINTPNDQHFEIAGAALAAGKHVCCEKPLTTTSLEALALRDIAHQTGSTLFTAFHRRYNSNLRERLPQLLNHSNIASVSAEYLERIQDHSGNDSWYLDPRRSGGGCIADNGPNVFDALRSFLGPLMVVSADIVRRESVDTLAAVKMLSHKKIRVDVLLDWDYDDGEKKQIAINLNSGQTILVDFLEGFPKFKESLWHEYVGVIEDFLDHIAKGQLDDGAGYEDVRLVESAYACEEINEHGKATG